MKPRLYRTLTLISLIGICLFTSSVFALELSFPTYDEQGQQVKINYILGKYVINEQPVSGTYKIYRPKDGHLVDEVTFESGELIHRVLHGEDGGRWESFRDAQDEDLGTDHLYGSRGQLLNETIYTKDGFIEKYFTESGKLSRVEKKVGREPKITEYYDENGNVMDPKEARKRRMPPPPRIITIFDIRYMLFLIFVWFIVHFVYLKRHAANIGVSWLTFFLGIQFILIFVSLLYPLPFNIYAYNLARAIYRLTIPSIPLAVYVCWKTKKRSELVIACAAVLVPLCFFIWHVFRAIFSQIE